jgi:hypothetical protein
MNTVESIIESFKKRQQELHSLVHNKGTGTVQFLCSGNTPPLYINSSFLKDTPLQQEAGATVMLCLPVPAMTKLLQYFSCDNAALCLSMLSFDEITALYKQVFNYRLLDYEKYIREYLTDVFCVPEYANEIIAKCTSDNMWFAFMRDALFNKCVKMFAICFDYTPETDSCLNGHVVNKPCCHSVNGFYCRSVGVYGDCRGCCLHNLDQKKFINNTIAETSERRVKLYAMFEKLPGRLKNDIINKIMENKPKMTQLKYLTCSA